MVEQIPSWDVAESYQKTHPISGARWVKVIAHIRKNATGEVRKYETNEILHDDEQTPNEFNWSENNFSCDCNRELFFETEKEYSGDEECSDGRFSVNLENPVTGELYYREF